jgi:hypothetical protein
MNWVLRRLAKTRLLRYLLPRHPWLRERLTRAPDSRAVGVTKLVLKEMEMTCRNDLGRRSFLKSAAVLGGASTVELCPASLALRIHHNRLTLQSRRFRM